MATHFPTPPVSFKGDRALCLPTKCNRTLKKFKFLLEIASKARGLVIYISLFRASKSEVTNSKIRLLNCATRRSYLFRNSNTSASSRNGILEKQKPETRAVTSPEVKSTTFIKGEETVFSTRREATSRVVVVFRTVWSSGSSASFMFAGTQEALLYTSTKEPCKVASSSKLLLWDDGISLR